MIAPEPTAHMEQLDAVAAQGLPMVSVSAMTAREAALALRLRSTEVNPELAEHLRGLAEEFETALAAL